MERCSFRAYPIRMRTCSDVWRALELCPFCPVLLAIVDAQSNEMIETGCYKTTTKHESMHTWAVIRMQYIDHHLCGRRLQLIQQIEQTMKTHVL